MPNETSQPFNQTKRSPDDAALIEGVLGSQVAKEMKELAGAGKKGAKPKKIELSLSDDEAKATKKKEIEATPEKKRQEYVEWARKFGKDEEWIHDNFIFNNNGRVGLMKDIELDGTGFESFPPELYCVGEINISLDSNLFKKIPDMPEGVIGLTLNNNQITQIENIPRSCKTLYICDSGITCVENIPDGMNDLVLDNNHITVISDIPDYLVFLDLSNNPITDLGPLVGKRIDHFRLVNVPVNSIPDGIEIDILEIESDQKHLEADAKLKGYHVHIAT